MDEAIAKERVERVLAVMEERGIDCFLIPPSPDLRYLTGYASSFVDKRLLMLVISRTSAPFFISNALYRPRIEQMPIKDAVFWQDGQNAIEVLVDSLEKRAIRTEVIAIEGTTPAHFLLPFQERLCVSQYILGAQLTNELRLVKDGYEIDNLVKAGALADAALRRMIEKGNWVGKTERDFSDTLIGELKRQGMGGNFGCVVAVGSNGASPHHSAGAAIIREDESLLVDFGASYQGYYADMTRTFFIGKPPDKFKEVYEIVRIAQQRAIDAVRPGVTAESVDRVARAYIAAKGYGQYFIHRTGHGIGIEVHENPYIVEGNERVLEAGMAFSIEPGIYLPGEFGVRIEDIVVVSENGARVMNHFPKRLEPIVINMRGGAL